jgi:hypothetical protein
VIEDAFICFAKTRQARIAPCSLVVVWTTSSDQRRAIVELSVLDTDFGAFVVVAFVISFPLFGMA